MLVDIMYREDPDDVNGTLMSSNIDDLESDVEKLLSQGCVIDDYIYDDHDDNPYNHLIGFDGDDHLGYIFDLPDDLPF